MKMIKVTSLMCLLLFAQLSFGQITSKHSFKNDVVTVSEHYGDPSVFKYLEADQDKKTITIYSQDYSVYKTIQLENDEEVSFYDVFPLFTDVVNSDPLIELCYTTRDVKQGKVNCVAYIINEDGELIRKFQDVVSVDVVCMDGKLELRLFKNNLRGKDIYSLGTNLNNTNLK